MSKPIDFAPLTPELCVSDIKTSLPFYTKILGFNILYQREEEGFAYLEREGAQIMLDEIVPHSKRSWISAPLEAPFGRGMNLDIRTSRVEDLYAAVLNAKVRVFLPIEEKWYRADDVYVGCKQFIVLDPDGFMLRFSESLGRRKELEV